MKRFLIVILLIHLGISGFSQKKQIDLYEWELETRPDTSVYDTSLHAIFLTKKLIKEFVYEDQKLVEYFLVHQRAKLLTHRAVNDFNKVYIPLTNDALSILEKGRVIKADGTISVLDEKSILTGKDKESQQEYRYFAFEGVEVGSEIEYLYVLKKDPFHTGVNLKVQSQYPVYNYGFDLYVPSNLIYQFKSFNNLPEFEIDTIFKGGNHWMIKMDTVPELKIERLANYDCSLMSFGYKLHQNLANGSKDIVSYGPYAKNLYSNVYELDKKKSAVINKLIKDIKPDLSSEERTIRDVEDYFKKNFAFYKVDIPELSNLQSIYDNKAFNEDGALLVYANIFKKLGISASIVSTCDRWELKFDDEFEAYNYLEVFMLYFPQSDKILAPTNLTSRLGIPPQEYTNNYGLFIKEVSLGDVSYGVGKIKFIEPVDMDKTNNSIHVGVSFESDFAKTKLITTQELTGYDAAYCQPVFQLIDDPKDLEDFQKKLVNIFNIDEEAETYEIINDKGSDFAVKPLILKSTFNTDKLTEKAGNTYLFKVGQLIGPQMELYETKDERVCDIEFYYNRKYYRKLIIEKPKGYSVNNLEKLNFNNTYVDAKGDTVFAFISGYSETNETIEITIEEWYDGLNYGKEVWDNYREIVNAAANFNKVVIFFKPE